MDVPPVGVHRALPVGDAPDKGEGGVENGQAQNQEGHGEGDHRVELEQPLDGHSGQNITQEGGPGVPHKHLGGVEVVRHKAHTGPYQRRHNDGHLRLGGQQGDDQHGGGRDGGDAVGQAVQPVDEVYGVGDGHNPQHREGHGQWAQHPVKAVGENVGIGKRLDDYTVQGGNQGGDDLDHEFQHGGQGHNVVHHAQYHDDDGAQEDALHLAVSPDVSQNEDADHKADEDGQAPQQGDGVVVHTAVVLGYVHRAHLVGEGLNHGGHEEADDQRRQQGEGHVGNQPVI